MKMSKRDFRVNPIQQITVAQLCLAHLETKFFCQVKPISAMEFRDMKKKPQTENMIFIPYTVYQEVNRP
jgi:hypothetical protein